MKTKILLLIAFLSLNAISYSQFCGTPSSQNYQKNERTKQERGFDRLSIQLAPPVCLNIFYHIVRESDGTGGIAVSQLDAITNYINQEFNTHNLFFNSLGHSFIDNSSYLSIDSDTEAESITSFNRPDAVNIYIVNNLWNVGNGQVVGTAVDIPSINLVINRGFVTNPVLAHELGHCLNLLHTHETAHGIENIPRNNCTWAGDQLCDTPADPGLNNGNVDIQCNYIGGGDYIPDTNNIMSYSRIPCLEHFTNGQEIRIRDAIFSEPILQNIVSNSCSLPVLYSNSNVSCDDLVITYNLENAEPPVTWSYSNNVQLVGSSDLHITVRAFDNENNGIGFIQANFGSGIELRKNFWVGNPTQSPAIVALTQNFPDSPVDFTFELNNWISTNQGSLTDQQWNIFPGTMVQSEDQFSVWIKTPSNIGVYLDYYFRLKNECGWGPWAEKHGVTINDPNGGGWLQDVPIYPNSSNEAFNIDLREGGNTTYYIYLYDNYGTVLRYVECTNILRTIDTLGLNEGVYFLHIFDGNELVIKQIVVNH